MIRPAIALAATLMAATALPAQTFEFNPAGKLQNARARGVTDGTVYAPGIVFPVDHTPSYANSQVWMIGGSNGPPGSWKDRRNFTYPWSDNFCETRSRRTPACPAGVGHQGQDIRVGLGEKDKFWAVAAEAGRISNVGLYSVELTGTSGTRYRYLHLRKRSLRVTQGQAVQPGDRIGLVADEFGGTPTPVHLHFEMLQNINGSGLRHVTPYMSLVRAYQRRLGTP
ncbi:M23 family metallopeptidase [Sphingomonas sp. 1P06PA]|uniref:M23 family metallopeptidase n=1 Tax=Sphingomonas sp. 1P06PA TaxID=554121 RepID=UPI0039A6DB54